MEIREARRADWEAIDALVRAAFHEDYRTTSEALLGIETLEDKLRSLIEEFDASGSRFLVATEDRGGKVVGAVLARMPQPGRFWVEDIFVATGARRSGIATELISAATAPAADVYCEVNAKNAVALQTFKSLGFERVVETVVFRRRAQ